MTTETIHQALETLTATLADTPQVAPAFYAKWLSGPHDPASDLGADIVRALDVVDGAMPAWTQKVTDPTELKKEFSESTGEVFFIWCAANAARTDARLAGLLAAAVAHPEYREKAIDVARKRVVEGPLDDALRCAPLLGTGAALALPENAEARARMEILIWEAGAQALQLPELGKWVWGSEETFNVLVAGPARGSLRGRVLAARCLEVAACGLPPMTDQRLVGRTLQVLQPLLLHPEPMVWIHAARSFGRLVGVFEPLEGTLLDWVHGATPVLRQRALTAFASLPANRLAMLGHNLQAILDSPEEKAWGLAAAAAATPHLFFERRKVWENLASRIIAGDGGAVAARALGRGLATLWRRGVRDEIEEPYRQLRLMARRANTDNVDDWRRWLELIAVTDPVDGAERDPLDVEIGLENLVRLAAQYDDEEADARAARFAATLAPTFEEARRIVFSDGSMRHRATGINAFEGCARSLALRLWGPMLTTRPKGDHIAEPDLLPTWELVAGAPAELLDIVREYREAGDTDERLLLALEVLALKLGGYALDACSADSERDLGPGRGPTAHATCLWLRKLQGLTDGSREMPPALQSALSGIFWRLVDTTRGTSLGEVDDVAWLGPFAAWWALVIDRPAILTQLATALPMIADGALEKCCDLAGTARAAIDSGAADGAWGQEAAAALAELRAEDTELAEALAGLATALAGFEGAMGPMADLEAKCLSLVMASERLQAALADPVRALHAATDAPSDDSLARALSDNAPRMASVMARAIRAREMTLLDVWFASLGPLASGLVEVAVADAMRRTPPPPPKKKLEKPKEFEGYEMIRPLGEGGIGTVWLVRKPGADRLFVLKIPKRDALENATETERAGILASFIDEARALAGLYHPNVANIIDRGVVQGVPFLILEYLIGADLQMYSDAGRMSLFELHRAVPETCAGLTALHNAGLVHRDIKPANLWLRLPLAGGVKFDPNKHRDPANAAPLSSVVIDFGMVRAQRVSAEVGGRFVAGTPGYIAPEQVLDPVELDGRADVYALAGTIYNVTTGHKFFEEIEDPRQRIVAHMQRAPLENIDHLGEYPAALVKLMRAATDMDWKDRPTPLEFGKAFADLL
ncbi:MAG: serine/threonine protein kinase [Deltaproteobacteria bacterium]|nr:serine/threonine protein kinase [Deltaproteobacteria bacterium]